MAERVDALKDTHKGLDGFEGGVLDEDLDDVLQKLVAEAARALEAPIALVSLVLDRTQFFRAHVGLPEDLATTRATDRDVSFCQFVVKEQEEFEVNEASEDARVPQALVDAYGVEAYLGVPVQAGGRTLGSFCVIDTERREFDESQRQTMRGLAAKASLRLEELRQGRSDRRRAELAELAVRPAIAELRNGLTSLLGSIDIAMMAAAEVRPLTRAVNQGASSRESMDLLRATMSAETDLGEALRDARSSADGIRRMVVALQELLCGRQQSLPSVLATAKELTCHLTRLVEPVTWPASVPEAGLALPANLGISVISAALSLFSTTLLENGAAGFTVDVEQEEQQTAIALISSHLPLASVQPIEAHLRSLLNESRLADTTSADHRLTLHFANAS